MFSRQTVTALVAAFCAVNLASAQQKISTEDFKKGVDAGSYDLILDVRTQDEWNGGHIPGAVHIPIDEFTEDVFWDSMDAAGYSCNKECATIVAHCSLGGRAETAIKKLQEMGFQGTLINGQGTDQWTAAGYELTTDAETTEPVCVSSDICPASAAESSDETTVVETDAAADDSSASSFGFGAAALAIPAVASLL